MLWKRAQIMINIIRSLFEHVAILGVLLFITFVWWVELETYGLHRIWIIPLGYVITALIISLIGLGRYLLIANISNISKD